MTDFVEGPDILETIATTQSMSTGDRLYGTINSGTDEDWVRVSLVSGQSYLITQNGLNISGGLSDPLVRLYNSAGVQVASDDDDGPSLDSLLTYTATTSGTFFIAADAFSTRTGGYELTFDVLHETSDAPQAGTTPFNVMPGQTFNGAFGPNVEDDQDRIAIEMQAGETYHASLEGFGNTDPGLRLFAPNGALLAQNDNHFGSSSSFISFTATATGTYYYQALARNGEGAYQLNVGTNNIEGPDAPQSAATPYEIAANETFVGEFNSIGDHDIIAMQVVAGQSYLIAGEGMSDTGSPRSMQLDVVNGLSRSVADETETFQGAEIVAFTAIQTGTVYLDAGVSVRSPATTNYELSAIMGGPSVTATLGDDILVGDSSANSVNLLAGDDFFAALGGNDTVIGGSGNDEVHGGDGFDLLRGGTGNDQLYGGANADNLLGEAGRDFMSGGAGFDRLFGGLDNDTMNGDAGTDGMFGQQGNDQMFGGADNDRMNGGPGNDYVDGGAGNDQLFGGAGFDTIIGGTGNDTLSGNFNADQFEFSTRFGDFGHDIVTDFAATNQFERINLFNVGEITDITDLFANHLSQVGNNAVITVDANNTITLQNVNVAQLDFSDFNF